MFSDFWALANLGTDTTIKRVVLSWYIDMLGNDSGSLAFWSEVPIVNTIEVTYGSPPPFPENPGQTFPDTQDFLHYDVTTMKGVPEAGTSILLSTAFNDGSVGRWDTSVQRRSLTEPCTVWWSWGAAYPGPFPASGALSRGVASVLYDTH